MVFRGVRDSDLGVYDSDLGHWLHWVVQVPHLDASVSSDHPLLDLFVLGLIAPAHMVHEANEATIEHARGKEP